MRKHIIHSHPDSHTQQFDGDVGSMIQAASGKDKPTMFPLVILLLSSNKAVYVCLCLPALSLLFHMCCVTQHHMNEVG